MKKILYISDLDFKGSGYMQVSVPLCRGLAEMGYDVRVIGLNYGGNDLCIVIIGADEVGYLSQLALCLLRCKRKYIKI